MSDKSVINNDSLVAVADKIREKTGLEETFLPSQMADGVNDVYEAGKVEVETKIGAGLEKIIELEDAYIAGDLERAKEIEEEIRNGEY